MKTNHAINSDNAGACPMRKSQRVTTLLMSPVEAVRVGAIEDGVRPLVEALNACGMTTIASCAGHAARIPWFDDERHPFVMFRAPVEFARAIAQRLQHGSGRDESELHYYWIVQGHFYPDTWVDLVWSIKAPSVRVRWNRQKLDADLATLAHFTQSISGGSLDLRFKETL